jgi:hypothetical protein
MTNIKYPSRYSNGKYVSAAQYITEIICENKAKKDKLDLHHRFWLTPLWEKYYRNQIASAHSLLKKYSAKAIIGALSDSKASKIYSLRAPHLIPIIEQKQALCDAENTEFTLDINRKENISFRRSKDTKDNIINKLKDLDNGS